MAGPLAWLMSAADSSKRRLKELGRDPAHVMNQTADELIDQYNRDPLSIVGMGSISRKLVSPQIVERFNKGFDHKSRTRLEEMTPDDFLRLANPLVEDAAVTERRVQALMESIQRDKLQQPLWLETGMDLFDPVKSVIGHEGRHRALAAKRLGMSHVPVEIRDEHTRWSEQLNPDSFDYKAAWPRELKTQDGSQVVDWPWPRGPLSVLITD